MPDRHILGVPLSDEAPSAGRVIVTYGRSLMALAIARSLHEHGVDVIGCDDVNMTVLSFSRHVMDNFTHTAFEKDEEQALADFEEAVRRYAPEDDRPYVLMPAFRDARLFAKYRERFEPAIRVAAPDLASIEMISPKDHFARFLEASGLPGPATRILEPGTFRNGLPADLAADLPLIAKPTDGVGGRGVKMIRDRTALDTYLKAAGPERPILLQELVEGEDYCVSIIADHGDLAGIVVYRNLAQFPREAGAGAVRETVDDTPFREAARALLKATGWNGVGEIDFRWNGDPSTPPKMIEMNPRYWAGLYHSMSSGVDFPWLAFQLAAGRALPAADPHAVLQGHRTRTPGAWILSAAQDLAASDPDLERAAEAWAQSRRDASRKEILSAANRLLESASAAAKGARVFKEFRKRLEEQKDLPSELDFDDDPAVGLGILFVVSSLLKHREAATGVQVRCTSGDRQGSLRPHGQARHLPSLRCRRTSHHRRHQAGRRRLDGLPRHAFRDLVGRGQSHGHYIKGPARPPFGGWPAFRGRFGCFPQPLWRRSEDGPPVRPRPRRHGGVLGAGGAGARHSSPGRLPGQADAERAGGRHPLPGPQPP